MISIERFEGEFALLIGDDGRRETILKSDLPEAVREGDILTREDGQWAVDAESTKAKRGANNARLLRIVKQSQQRDK